jgi:hypothetical protein
VFAQQLLLGCCCSAAANAAARLLTALPLLPWLLPLGVLLQLVGCPVMMLQ